MKTFIIGVVVLILVALGFWYTSSRTPVTTISQQTVTTGMVATTTATTTKANGSAQVNTFRSIFSQSGNHQCSFEQVTSSGKTSSVIYIADGKMRGEFRNTSGTSAGNLMIYNGGLLYTWKEGTKVGVKTNIKTVADLPNVIPKDLTSGAIFGTSGTNVSWDCHDWSKNDSFFVIPSYVKFSAAS